MQKSTQKLWDVKRDILHIAVGIIVFMQDIDMALLWRANWNNWLWLH